MKELSLNVLDIAQNSVAAGAHYIRIELVDFIGRDLLEITVEDNGCGMDSDFLRKVTDPFITTRTTRKVGMGIPLFKMAAEMSGGTFAIESAPGNGTKVKATFQRSHIDRPPIGNMAETITVLLQGNPSIRLICTFMTDQGEFVFDTDEILREIGTLPIDTPEIIRWIREYIDENTQDLFINQSSQT